MRFILFDIDTLRADRLGCYGYQRPITPNMDRLAQESMQFNNYYCADAPCLPSRGGLVTGMFGIHSGIVGHGGTAADLRLGGQGRGMFDMRMMQDLFWQFRKHGMYTASVSSFSERHSAYWFNAGLNEVINVGEMGDETADTVAGRAVEWLDSHKDQDNWFLHIHMWDPHTPYRAPDDAIEAVEKMPLPDWYTEELFEEHMKTAGPHTLNNLNGFSVQCPDVWKKFKKHPGKAVTYEEYRHLLNLYDAGVYFADRNIGRILDRLREHGIYEDTAVILTADHGENESELGIYAEHATADYPTCHIPMLIKWPGLNTGIDNGFRYQLDLLPTVAELFGLPAAKIWDGSSYASVLDPSKKGKAPTEKQIRDRYTDENGYEYLVITQCAHVCQRSVRFGDYIYIRTYHDGLFEFPREMLFNLKKDPRERENLVEKEPEICGKAARLLLEWEQTQMERSASQIDPLWTVMKEGGPLHAGCDVNAYTAYLEESGRGESVPRLKKSHPELFR